MIRRLAPLLLIAGTSTALLAATPAVAATTTVAQGTRGATIGVAGPIGQSFVADGTGLSSFGFQFAIANSAPANAPVTFQLLAGAGLGGSVIATRSATLAVPAGRTPTWFDFDLTGTALTLGQSYTALLSTTTTRLAMIFGPNLSTSGVPATGDAYTAGTLVSAQPIDAFCTNGGTCDANFRFTTTALTAAVPEPGSWALLFAGTLVAGTALRRRSRVTMRVAFAG